eukprot:scaffold206959_cov24-Prasinocladus_malaysianus.AAC.1
MLWSDIYRTHNALREHDISGRVRSCLPLSTHPGAQRRHRPRRCVAWYPGQPAATCPPRSQPAALPPRGRGAGRQPEAHVRFQTQA